jgi:hypothetical protein
MTSLEEVIRQNCPARVPGSEQHRNNYRAWIAQEQRGQPAGS